MGLIHWCGFLDADEPYGVDEEPESGVEAEVVSVEVKSTDRKSGTFFLGLTGRNYP